MPPRHVDHPGSPKEWILHALVDLELARMPIAPFGMYDQLCFHAQQATEKSIKAVLIHRGVRFPRTHDIQLLVSLVPLDMRNEPALLDSVRLTPYAVNSRYPGLTEPTTENERKEAVRIAEAVSKWAAYEVGVNIDEAFGGNK